MAATREARAVWNGDLMSGTGAVSAVSSGRFSDLPVSWSARTEAAGGKTSPEELLAAAHATCFSMALSSLLAQAGNPPESVQTDATVTLRPVDGRPTITKIELVTVGRVPGLDEAAFVEQAKAAKAGCPVSRALAGVPEITLEASLAS